MNKTGLILTVILLAAIWGVGISIADNMASSTEAAEYIEKAKSFCYQTTGDPTLVNARVMGEHGGIHCKSNKERPHLHAYSAEALEDAREANVTGSGFEPSEYETESYRFLGFRWLLALVFVIGGGVIGLGLMHRYREDETG